MNTQLSPGLGTEDPRTPDRGLPAGRDALPGFAARHRRRLLRADALTVAACGSLAASVSLWLADGGTAGVSTVASLKLTDHEGRSVQISNYAAPILRSEVLQAQSADVQTVGGATVTSDAYLTSLQAALDAANL